MLVKLCELERESIYKYVSIDDFKTAVGKIKEGNITKSILMVFGKPHHRLENSNKNKLIHYLETHLYDENQNDIKMVFEACFMSKLTARFKNLVKLTNLVKDYKYNEYSEEVKAQIEEYRTEYENTRIRLDFDLILKCFSLPNNEEALYEQKINKLKDELDSKNQEKELILNDMKELEKINKEHEKKYKELMKYNDTLISKYEKKNKEYEDLKNHFQVEQIVSKFSDFIDLDQSYSSYQDIYDLLEKQEHISLKNQEYDKVKQLLSAKYALILIMEDVL